MTRNQKRRCRRGEMRLRMTQMGWYMSTLPILWNFKASLRWHTPNVTYTRSARRLKVNENLHARPGLFVLGPHDAGSQTSITVANPTAQTIAFKVMTTSLKVRCMRSVLSVSSKSKATRGTRCTPTEERSCLPGHVPSRVSASQTHKPKRRPKH